MLVVSWCSSSTPSRAHTALRGCRLEIPTANPHSSARPLGLECLSEGISDHRCILFRGPF
ncbi:uncharacterized protein QC763_0030210 [Podospora pseudopauciseta]|uniref:Uncharacterized protein n=1 Tax=Podospora pseudopauciseta TaxID=2093780 RepID=A0ABR0HMB2_9PEZI|nr:hypothetical protein QC763_0030210 [Podospora pseudopauciseta]